MEVSRLCDPAIADAAAKKLQRTGELYGAKLTRVALLPNAHIEGGHISGISMDFAADAPMFADVVGRHFLTGGTCIVKVNDAPKNWMSPARQPKKKLTQLLLPTEGSAPFSLQSRNPETNRDKEGFVFAPTLGDGHAASAGVYTCVNPSGDGKEQTYIVVQASIPSLSADISRFVASHATHAQGTSTDEGLEIFTGPRRMSTTLSMRQFVDDPRVRYAINAGMRNRAAIAASVAQELGMKIDTVIDSGSSQHRLLAVPVLDQLNYALEKNGSGGFTYRSNALNTESARVGACVGLAPAIGYMVLQNDTATTHTNAWANDHGNAFPANVARTLAVHDALSGASSADAHHFSIDNQGTHPFCWTEATPFNDKMHTESYQRRTGTFKASEYELGKDHTTGEEMHLRPVCVVLSASK
jgi:hypothetical protein